MRKYTWLQKLIIGAILNCILFISVCAIAALPEDKSAAVVFMYQRVGEDSVPQSNISIDQFKEHLNELKKGGYTILPLGKIVDAVKNNEPLPPKTVALTFEGAYQATLANAVPLLEEAQIPFTIFLATDMIDSESTNRMSWDQLRKLHKKSLVTLGLLPSSYEHLVNLTPEKNAELINRALGRYHEMLGEDPLFFAYPYGEYNTALKNQVSGYKFKAAFGQQSGVVHSGADVMALPRFTMTNDYGDLDRFMLTANALPLPVTDAVPEDSVITQNPPTIGFTVTPALHKLDKLSCFASDQGKLPLMRIKGNRIEIRPPQPFTDRRTRINCTLPNETITPGEPQNWRWFGMLLTTRSIEEDTSTDVPPPGSGHAETPDNSTQN